MDIIPPFQPRIRQDHGSGDIYEDGRVTASIDVTDTAVNILEFSSHHPGCGHTREALQWLRQRFQHVSASGVGLVDEIEGVQVPDDTVTYWARMRDKGLIDEIIDDEGYRLDDELKRVVNEDVESSKLSAMKP